MTDAAVASLLRMLVAQTVGELRIRWRLPAFSVLTLALPVVFFTFFGLPLAAVTTANGVNIGAVVLASLGTYAVGSVMVFGSSPSASAWPPSAAARSTC
jgi:hypothetical protein